MPSCFSSILTTDDVDRFSAAIRPNDANFSLTARGRFSANHALVNLNRVRLQGGEESLSRIWEGEINRERHAISFHMLPGPSLFINGTEVGPGEIALHNSSNAIFCHRLSGATRWGSMSLSRQDWLEMGTAVAGHDVTPPVGQAKIAVSKSALLRLQRLHAAATHLAEHAPELIANPDAARGLENELMQAMVDCIATSDARVNTAAQRHHATIMKRFTRALEENADRPIYLGELCAAAKASDRTLRLCCQEYLGVGPKRYLHLRRMHLAQRALLKATVDADSVTSIATQFGFWELGRFAVDYRTMFGEPPSTTLRRPRPL